MSQWSEGDPRWQHHTATHCNTLHHTVKIAFKVARYVSMIHVKSAHESSRTRAFIPHSLVEIFFNGSRWLFWNASMSGMHEWVTVDTPRRCVQFVDISTTCVQFVLMSHVTHQLVRALVLRCRPLWQKWAHDTRDTRVFRYLGRHPYLGRHTDCNLYQSFTDCNLCQPLIPSVSTFDTHFNLYQPFPPDFWPLCFENKERTFVGLFGSLKQKYTP